MKRLVLLGWMLAAAMGAGWGQVESERVRVLYPRPELAAYAERVAREAEAALDVLEPLFGPRSGRVVLRLNDTVDLFNAYATPVPRRTVELLAPVPAGAVIDLRSPSVGYLLLVHELTHTRQLTFRELPGGKRPLRLGLVTELSAPMPPAWFVEGVATYMESRFTPGGRLDWAYTQGLINALLEEDRFPDLADMSLYTYRDWPRGQTRYLLGVRFVQYLIERYGWDAVLATLRQYNTGLVAPPPFAAAWERASGVALTKAWGGWVALERERAAAYERTARSYEVVEEKASMPARSPDGRRLAYVKEGWIVVAGADGGGARKLVRSRPQRLWWKDDRTLLYSRYVPEGDGVASDVFELDVERGRERRLTRGLHARLAAPAPGGCFDYLRDRAGEPAELLRRCPGGEEVVWVAAKGEHPLGLAVSPEGRVALAVWHEGSVDIAVLESGRLKYLAAGRLGAEPPAPPPDPCSGEARTLDPCYPRGRPMHTGPVWEGEDRVVFRAGEPGVYELFRVDLASGRIERLTHSRGGFLGAAVGGGVWTAAELGPDGPRLVRLQPAPEPVKVWGEARYFLFVSEGDGLRPAPQESPGGADQLRERAPGLDPRLRGEPKRVRPAPRPPLQTEKAVELRRRTYDPLPSLKPYGWLPTNLAFVPVPPYAALEASVYGLDDARVYSYRAVLGFDPALSGAPLGAYAYLEAGAGAGVDLVGPTGPLGFTVRAGAWPSGDGVVFGVVPGLASQGLWDRWNWRAGFEAGPVWSAAAGWRGEYRGFVRAGQEVRDPWGYLTAGGYGGMYGGTGYAWALAGAAWKLGARPLVAEARVLGGAGTPLPVGAAALGDALALEARLRYAWKVERRSEDGWLALERVTLAPAVYGRYDPAAGALAYGADLGVYADAVFFYALPLPLGVRAGWDGGWWWRIEAGPW
ncbi:hypothetical protein [Oceanithermus sp.]